MITLTIPDFWGGALAGCTASLLLLLVVALWLGWRQQRDNAPRAGRPAPPPPPPGPGPRYDPEDGPRNPWQVG